MALRSVISSKIPMVIILGATGTGKTKLSVELAKKFGAEIISADSMQVYKGLDVVTAKASAAERAAAPHHMLDTLEPHEMFTVVDFRDRTLKIIDDLTSQGKIPIIVGGTNYYIESIVYNILVQKMDETDELLWNKSRRKRDMEGECSDVETKVRKIEDTESGTKDETNTGESHLDKEPTTEIEVSGNEVDREKLKQLVMDEKNLTNEEVHSKLAAIDPVMATRLHPNNRRKIIRAIEYWVQTGRRHSEALAEQRVSEGQLRRPGATVLLWLQCEQTVHDQRLNDRVDSMLKEGLIQELLDFHDQHNKKRIQDGRPPDYTKGIFQTLGFKEFHNYLMLSDEQRITEEGTRMLAESVEDMRIATRRYARRQNKMVKGRFLEHPRRMVPPIYTLDTTDISKWDEEVKNKAIKIIESYLYETPCEYEPVSSCIGEEKKQLDTHSKNFCEICQRLIIGDKEYKIHLSSNRHAKVLKKKNKLKEEHQTSNKEEAETQ